MPKQGSLVDSVECVTKGLAQDLASQASVMNVHQAPTVNEPAGNRFMEDLEGEPEPNKGEPEPNEGEPSDGASST